MDPTRVFFDEPGSGELWAASRTYKASFDNGGFTYVPFFGSDAPRNFPIAFRLESAILGGSDVAMRPLPLSRSGARITLDHGGLRELLDLTPDHLQQSFVFDTLPSRGPIELSVAVETALRIETARGGLRFVHDRSKQDGLGHVDYSQAIAIDARGERLLLETTWSEDRIRIRVPESFVARATLPLTIDPYVTTFALSRGLTVTTSDSAFDHTYANHLLVWSQIYSATDHDVWAQRLDINLDPVGAPFAIDFTTDCWSGCAVANKVVGAMYLVVAQESANCASPFWISGRAVPADLAGSLGVQFDIEHSGVVGVPGNRDNVAPDVGGDPDQNGPSWFTVVWQHVYGLNDGDIYYKQVDETGALRSVLPSILEGSLADDVVPQISKSNGAGDRASQRWFVTFQRWISAADADIRYGTLSWDGQVVPIWLSNTQPVANFPSDLDVGPKVSSASDAVGGNRRAMIVWSRVSTGNSDVFGAVVDAGGMHWGTQNLHTVEGGGIHTNWPQLAGGVDCDGCRFAVSYSEEWSIGTPNYDALVSTFDLLPSGVLRCDERRVYLGASSRHEFAGEVAAMYGAYGPAQSSLYPLQRYVVTSIDQLTNSPVTAAIQCHYYDGMAPSGGLSWRATACGDPNLVFDLFSGDPALGNEMTFVLSDSGPLTGFFFGLPLQLPLNDCPGCVLGVNGTVVANPYVLRIPCVPAFVGATFAAQGFSFGVGSCYGGFSLTRTADLTVR